MNLSEWTDVIESAVPNGWQFVFSAPETILSYIGEFPLVFAHLPNEPMSFVANFGIQTTYQQKISFMVQDRLDSVGIGRKGTELENRIIQLPLLQQAQIAMKEFLLALQNVDGLPIVERPTAVPMPRFIVNGGQVLTGYELTFELKTFPIC